VSFTPLDPDRPLTNLQRLRFALLADLASLQPWHVRCLEFLRETAELCGTISLPHGQAMRSQARGRVTPRRFARNRATRSLTIPSVLNGIPNYADASAIAAAGLDFVLKLGSGPVAEGLQPFARHGVWHFEHELANDSLPFAREVYDGEDVTEPRLLSSRIENGRTRTGVIASAALRTQKGSYDANLARVVTEIAEWPARVCRRVAIDGGLRAAAVAERVHADKSLVLPSRRFLRLVTIRHQINDVMRQLFRHQQWNIGVLRLPVGALLAGEYRDSEIEWFPLAGKTAFLADPFGIARGAAIHVLCEHFDYRRARGHICAVDLSETGFSMSVPSAIALPHHMSYPCLVEDGEEIYCIPETYQSNRITLFRALEFPHKWEAATVLVDHFPGVDPTVFRHDGRWWLLCTRQGHNADSHLYIWHAERLNGPWIPHVLNPVKIDVRSSRPAGPPFMHEGLLYRPAQDCSRSYGWRIAIQRLVRLTPTDFVEHPVAWVQPSPRSPFPSGRHTLTPVGRAVLIDGSRDVFVWRAFWWFWVNWTRRAWIRLQPHRRNNTD